MDKENEKVSTEGEGHELGWSEFLTGIIQDPDQK